MEEDLKIVLSQSDAKGLLPLAGSMLLSLFCIFCAFSRRIDRLRDNAGRMEKEGNELAAKKRRKHKRKGTVRKTL